jgi:orotate phosphoribosyltransferase
MQLSKLKQLYVEGVYETRALLIREEPFTLQSGGQSHVYLNHRNFLSRGDYLVLVANIYFQLIGSVLKTEDYRLAVVDSIMSPIIVGAMCALRKKDLTVIKSTKLEHGTEQDIYGDCHGEVVIIDDMTSTGKTILEATDKIRAAGGQVHYAVVSALRDQTAVDNLAGKNVSLLHIASFQEILALLQPSLTTKEKALVASELGVPQKVLK